MPNFKSLNKCREKKEDNFIIDESILDEDDDEARRIRLKKKSMKKLEDVRASNKAFSQHIISTYISFYFAMLGVGSGIVASETVNYNNPDDINKDHIITMYTICDVSTFFQSKEN